jgi:hypothetical protein
MAGFFQQYIQGAAAGFFGSPYLRDPTHASKTFTTNGYGNAPKLKHLFHVYFEINDTLVSSNPGAFPDKMLPGLLVKNISLPKYSMTLSELNQYNRPRYVQTKLKYDPVQISFHDDALGAIKKIWYNYYSYYYNDTYSASSAPIPTAIKNTYNADIHTEQNWGYLGEPSTSAGAAAAGQPKPQFFKTIKIYGFNQHNFSLYTLVNPIIERFEHDTYDYYQSNSTMENKMTVRYETVTYQEGALNGEKPDAIVQGFGSDQYYDRRLSPIAKAGSNKTIMGPGGLVDALDGVITDLGKQPPDLIGAIQKAGTAAKTFKNTDAILTAAKSEIKTAALGALSDPQTVKNMFNFPAFSQTSNTTDTQAPPAP